MMPNIEVFASSFFIGRSGGQSTIHDPEGLNNLSYRSHVRMRGDIDKPYGICDNCYTHDENVYDLDHCGHFHDQPSDFDPPRYYEAAHNTA
jgi:hypothetical protein